MTVSDFHANLMNRIDSLEKKICQMKSDKEIQQGNEFLMLCREMRQSNRM